jgi:hypothetical protein
MGLSKIGTSHDLSQWIAFFTREHADDNHGICVFPLTLLEQIQISYQLGYITINIPLIWA